MMAGMLSWLLFNRYTAALAVILGLIFGAYWKGYSTASAKCRDAELRAQIASMERDMAAWKAADDVEKMLQSALEAERNDLQDKVTDYEMELAKRPDTKCTLDERDVRALGGLRGNRR